MKVIRTSLKEVREKLQVSIQDVRKAVVGALLGMVALGGVMAPQQAHAIDLGTLVENAAIGAVQMLGDKNTSDTEKLLIGQAAGVGVKVFKAAIQGRQVTAQEIQEGLVKGTVAGGAAMLTKKGSSDLERAGAAFGGALGYDITKEAYQKWKNAKKAVIISEEPRPAPRTQGYSRPTAQRRTAYQQPGYQETARTRCHKVHERVIENGKVVKDVVKEVCQAERQDPGYHGIDNRYATGPTYDYGYDYDYDMDI